MIESLKIGELVYDRLHDIEGISNRVYPLIADNGTNYPFIVYERTSIEPFVCKDGAYEDEVSISVKVVAATYTASIDLAQTVRERMTFTNLTDNGHTYTSTLTSADESYIDNVYVQSLYFRININK